MKNIIVACALIFGFVTTQAQKQNEKNTYIQQGELVEATLYFDSGEVSQTGFYTKNGKPTGKWISFNRKGRKTAEAQYSEGKKVGTWFFWNADTLTEVAYDNSVIASVNEWKNNQKIEIVINK